jgi:hypothetical protein
MGNPLSLIDPTGMGPEWREDGEGGLVKENGDNSQTLKKYIKTQTGVDISDEHAQKVNAGVKEGETVSIAQAVNASLLLTMPSDQKESRLIGHLAIRLGTNAYSFDGRGMLFSNKIKNYIDYDSKQYGMMEAPIITNISLKNVRSAFNFLTKNIEVFKGYNLIKSSCISSTLQTMNILGIETNNTRRQVVLPMSIMYEAYNKGIVGNAIYHNSSKVQNSIENILPKMWESTMWGQIFKGQIFK